MSSVGGMDTITIILLMLASWRLARLVTVDRIAEKLRWKVVDWAGHDSQRAYLITCPWCISVWSSIPLAAAVVWFPTNRGVLLLLLVLAGSGVAGIMQSVEDRLDR
jgi:hypothetical protein